MAKLPSFQFYPGDWMKDPALSICSAGARGIWMDVMCLMFESPQRGYLITNGKPWTLEQVAVALRGDWQENLIFLKELVHNGVMRQVRPQKPSRKCPRNVGAFFSKRLVTDEGQRTAWRAQKRRQRVEKKRNSVHPMSGPSSSSSSSSPSKTSSNSTFSQDSSMVVEETKGKTNGWIDRNEQRIRETDRVLDSFEEVAQEVRGDVPKRRAAKQSPN